MRNPDILQWANFFSGRLKSYPSFAPAKVNFAVATTANVMANGKMGA